MEANQKLMINQMMSNAVGDLVHDILSPLVTLKMGIQYATDLPENTQNFIMHHLSCISGAIHNSTQKYSAKNTNAKRLVLASEFILDIIAEKKAEYDNKPVQFRHVFTKGGELAVIRVDPSDLKRILSNIIDNSVAACEGKEGVININLSNAGESVKITIIDNGHGMPPEVVDKIRDNKTVTPGKINGQGICFKHIREKLANNGARFSIESDQVRESTTITLAFPDAGNDIGNC